MQAIHTLQASYIRDRASVRCIPGLHLARVRDPAERRAWLFSYVRHHPFWYAFVFVATYISYAYAGQDKCSSNK